LALTLTGAAALLFAASHDSGALERFESRYGSARAMQTKFLERYYDNGKQVRAEAGRAYFQRPGKMRWDYESPEKNTFLVDGKYVWFYSPADHTVTRMPTKQSEDWRTPLAFLTSHVKLSRICAVLAPDFTAQPTMPANEVYSCALRETAQANGTKGRVASLEITPGGELVRVLVPEEAGMRLEFSFGGWEFDPQLPKGLFEFTPPADAVILNGLLPDTPGMRQ
jgi:outer membrane lipoprotein carrier protein